MKTIEILGFKAKVARTFWERTRGRTMVDNDGQRWTMMDNSHPCIASRLALVRSGDSASI